MNDFSEMADQILDSFKTPTSAAWARKTGRRDMANALLDAMRKARSQEQFDNLAYRFKRDVLMPYYREVVMPQGSPSQRSEFLERNTLMQMRPRKPMGTYEELQKNPAFAQSRFKHLPSGTQDSVPSLLRIAQDPAEIDLAAREMGVAPEDLQAHIQDAYGRRAREQFRKDMMAAAMEGQRYRDALAEDYERSLTGRVLGAISPEVTGLRLKDIRTGTESSNWDMAKAIAKDALVGIGSLYTGGIAGKVVSNPMARAGLGGVLDASLEAARQGMSDYYDWDPQNIRDVGMVSATIPAGVGMLTSLGGKFQTGRRLMRPFRKKVYGMEVDPAAEEVATKQNKLDEMVNATKAAESGDPLAKEVADDLLEESRDFIERSHANVLNDGPLTTDDLRDIVMDPVRSKKYFNPPTEENLRSAVESKKYAGPNDIIDVNGQPKFESDVAEEYLKRTKAQWPANYRKSAGPRGPKDNFWDKYAGDIVDVFSREETMRQRTQGKKLEDKSATTALRQVMEYDPDMIRMWKAGFTPHDEAGKKLYDEWKEKFGG